MFAAHVDDLLRKIEAESPLETRAQAIAAIAALGLEDFGHVMWSMPNRQYPRLSALLPRMAPDEVTRTWTGASGLPLLEKSVSFVRACSDVFARVTGSSLTGKRILDFGCGYGRFLRLFSFYSRQTYGTDAWTISLDHCVAAGLGDIVRKSDIVPRSLPFDETFDFLFSFSVFTHLSEVSTRAALGALRSAARPGAMLALTFRPVEFWGYAMKHSLQQQLADAEACELRHAREGFAFLPHPSGEPTHEIHYGDTSMTLEWLQAAAAAKGWQLVAMDRTLSDSLQRYAFFAAA